MFNSKGETCSCKISGFCPEFIGNGKTGKNLCILCKINRKEFEENILLDEIKMFDSYQKMKILRNIGSKCYNRLEYCCQEHDVLKNFSPNDVKKINKIFNEIPK